MGLRFNKRLKLGPGLSLNLSKSGPSFAFGPRGFKYTIGPRGTRRTFGIPGTGLSYTTASGWGRRGRSGQVTPSSAADGVAPKLDLGFFGSLFIPSEEKQFVAALKLFLDGHTDDAYAAFKGQSVLSDAAFMHGFTALGRGAYPEAEDAFTRCRRTVGDLGKALNKYAQSFHLSLQVTDYIDAPIAADERGLTLAQAEALQKQGKHSEAIRLVTDLRNRAPADPVLCLSLCELVVTHPGATSAELDGVVRMTDRIDNDEPIHTNILYLRGAAFYRMQMRDGALAQLAAIVRKKADRPEALLHQIRYLRGRLYEQGGETQRSHKEYELIYSVNSAFRDVAARLGK